MTIASLIEAEGRGDYQPKIARVIYNRLEIDPDTGVTNGLLQIDATVNYALGTPGVAGSTPTTRSTRSRTRRTTPTRRRACRRARSRRPATRRSRPRSTRPRGRGSSTSRSTSRPARPSSPTTTTSSSSSRQEYQEYCDDPVRPAAECTASGRCAAPSSVTRSTTRCRRSSTAPPTRRSGLEDWHYDAVLVAAGGLADFVAGLDPHEWRGLSLTMPLKREALPLLDSHDDWVAATGACNTRAARARRQPARAQHRRHRGADGAGRARRARWSGPWCWAAGATATSVLLALAERGMPHATLVVRDPVRAAETVRAVAGHRAGPSVEVRDRSTSSGR